MHDALSTPAPAVAQVHDDPPPSRLLLLVAAAVLGCASLGAILLGQRRPGVPGQQPGPQLPPPQGGGPVGGAAKPKGVPQRPYSGSDPAGPQPPPQGPQPAQDQQQPNLDQVSQEVERLRHRQDEQEQRQDEQQLMLDALKSAVDWSLAGTEDSSRLLVACAKRPNGPALIRFMTAVYKAQLADWSAYVTENDAQAAQQMNATLQDLRVADEVASVASFIPIAGPFIGLCMKLADAVVSGLIQPRHAWAIPGYLGYGWFRGCYWMDYVPIPSWMAPRCRYAIRRPDGVGDGLPRPDEPDGVGYSQRLVDLCTAFPFGAPVPWVQIMASENMTQAAPHPEVFYLYPYGDLAEEAKLRQMVFFDPDPQTESQHQFVLAWNQAFYDDKGTGIRHPFDIRPITQAVARLGIRTQLGVVTSVDDIAVTGPTTRQPSKGAEAF